MAVMNIVLQLIEIKNEYEKVIYGSKGEELWCEVRGIAIDLEEHKSREERLEYITTNHIFALTLINKGLQIQPSFWCTIYKKGQNTYH